MPKGGTALRGLKQAIVRNQSVAEVSLANQIRKATERARQRSGPRQVVELGRAAATKMDESVLKDARVIFTSEFLRILNTRAAIGDESAICEKKIRRVAASDPGVSRVYLSLLRDTLHEFFDQNGFQVHFSCVQVESIDKDCECERPTRIYDSIVFVVTW